MSAGIPCQPQVLSRRGIYFRSYSNFGIGFQVGACSFKLHSSPLANARLNRLIKSVSIRPVLHSKLHFLPTRLHISGKRCAFSPVNCLHNVSEPTESASVLPPKKSRKFQLGKFQPMDHKEEEMQSMIPKSILQEGVYRFDADEDAFLQSFPSLSFETPLKREVKIDGKDFDSEGQFSISCLVENGDQTVLIQFSGETNFYATGEVSGSLERTGKRIFAWNTDSWAYNSFSRSLYQSHPFVFCVMQNGKCIGFLADTTKKCDVDLRKNNTIRFKSNQFYPIISFGPYQNPNDVLASLSNATGKCPLPPLWALGFHQCRFSYEPDSRVLQVAKTFREKKLPCDVIWMDIDYMNKFLCFTFDPIKFPNPKKLVQELKEIQFKTIWMIDPGIKADDDYFVFQSGKMLDVFVKDENGSNFEGEVWPGLCCFPDFTMKKAREWWAKLISEFCDIGLDGIWNDMNEPSVFQVMTKTMPESNIHRGDENLGGTQNHAYYHNVYGMLMARSTFEGFQMYQKNKRPFVLSRAGFIGSQRYSATWTGDNLANWQHLHWSITMALNLNLSGQPFCGPDIGGFVGNSSPDLFARWMGIGCLLPFARAHSTKVSSDHEPWAFGEECEHACKLALERRYRLLPHFYTLFHRAYKLGYPVMKPLFFADTKDERLRRVEDSFLLGDLLVVANTKEDTFLLPNNVILPNGIWRRFDFDDYHEDIPLLFAKGGSILFAMDLIQSTEEYSLDKDLNLIITLDETGYAEGEIYEDEGNGFGFRKGQYLITKYRARVLHSDISIENLPEEIDLERNVTTHNGTVPTSTNYFGKAILIEIFESSGSIPRHSRKINYRILLSNGVEISGHGIDGQKIVQQIPPRNEFNELATQAKIAFTAKLKHSEERFLRKLELKNQTLKNSFKESNLEDTLVSGQFWRLNVSKVKGRINSMYYMPYDKELLKSNLEFGGYEEFFNSQTLVSENCEPYSITLDGVKNSKFEFKLNMEADIGGGLVSSREIFSLQNPPNILQIHSSIQVKNLEICSGGISRVVRLRIRPNFQFQSQSHQVFVNFVSLDGEEFDIYPEFGEVLLSGNNRPNGLWSLVDLEAGTKLLNRFNIDEVELCLLNWSENHANLELWSNERPVSESSPLQIHHEYEIVSIGNQP